MAAGTDSCPYQRPAPLAVEAEPMAAAQAQTFREKLERFRRGACQ